ncbi:unnamed protein product [Didymodactylos carnosus]|uniref:Uncharacterized protein n=1 Tax=Didymodactylos carnosus TaxID=1234261 RepID=A0A8S2E7K5_9BILA|nr:unnamed protein product [Didymodactylos carnosus]CAF3848282.1 unnamed protein product [Didymodactylos carnosus]
MDREQTFTYTEPLIRTLSNDDLKALFDALGEHFPVINGRIEELTNRIRANPNRRRRYIRMIRRLNVAGDYLAQMRSTIDQIAGERGKFG